MGFFNYFTRTRSLVDLLTETHQVKIHGVWFEIRKLGSPDYMSGSKALIQLFDVYKTNTDKQKLEAEAMLQTTKKIKEHYADVFLAAVVSPKLVRNEADSGQGIWVENLFSDWELVNDLYSNIMQITYGKKKMKSLTLQKTAS